MIDNYNKLAQLQFNKNYYITWGLIANGLWIEYRNKEKMYSKNFQAWSKGVNWFNNANSQWETIIGAREYTSTTQDFWTCFCRKQNMFNPNMSITVTNPADCALQGCVVSSHYQVVTINTIYKPSDGVVLNESAMNLPGYSHPPVKIKENENGHTGSSHMQIRNDVGLKIALIHLLNGGYGPFFETAEP